MNIRSQLTQLFDAHEVEPVETLQELWSGYGSIVRYHLSYANERPDQPSSIIVKSIQPPHQSNHPRGWNTPLSHQRKLRSYEVETHWYQQWAHRCGSQNGNHSSKNYQSNNYQRNNFQSNNYRSNNYQSNNPLNNSCKVARCYGVLTDHHQTYIILEDLDASGYFLRAESLTPERSKVCLRWLAAFHSRFLTKNPTPAWPEGLWPKGSYWHLDTRPDELENMEDSPLKQYAKSIDRHLHECTHKTLVHGDAKVANFCFSHDGSEVAAVDFQYVGGGCGIKDVVYFLGSCLSEEECEQHYEALLDEYFVTLRQALSTPLLPNGIDPDALETEWRALFSFAWADFHRFILGWSPGHRKNNTFSQAMAAQALAELNSL